jgi:aldehyde:ferredoxin oxidoreductase
MSAQCYNGKILHLDLSTKKSWVETPSENFYRSYGGGSSMGLYYILNETSPGVDPFSPENILTLFAGVPTGLPISGLSRLCINARSPLTLGIGDSQSGGFFPAELKFAGYDGIVIRGKASRPVYLWIHDGNIEIMDASHLWGRITGDTEALIKNEIGDNKAEVLQIGPAGENLVRFAAIISMSNRANGRTGMGAVMGSKNLKAVVVRGKQKIKAADPRTISNLFKEGSQDIRENPLYLHGTPRTVGLSFAAGNLPTQNFNQGQFAEYENIDGYTMTETILKERDTCFSCSVRCKRVVETDYKEQAVLPHYGGPEYETIGLLGSSCGISDLSAICLANQLCNQYGMDTISCGGTIAFAMECFENGLISIKDTGGIDLRFGNTTAMIDMVNLIARREAFGNLLAEGSMRAARQIGKGSEDYLVASKGNEFPAHMPEAKKSLGLIYAVNPFGADHMSSEHDPFYEIGTASPLHKTRMSVLGLTDPQPHGSINSEKIRMTYITQKYHSALDSFCLCIFVWGSAPRIYGPAQTVEMLNAATGWDLTIEELLEIGERKINMMRIFNAREGLTRDDDTLPAKLFRPLEGSGPTTGEHFTKDQVEAMKDQYYSFAGWNVSTGNPSAEKLASLGLDWAK